MAETKAEPSRFNWRWPSYATLVVFAVFISLALCREDSELWTALFLVAPVLILVSIALLIYAIISRGRRKRLTLLSTVAALAVASVAMLFFNWKYGFAIRTTARWLISSRNYKSEVLAQPASRES